MANASECGKYVTMHQHAMPSIFGFRDFKLFLKAYYENAKAKDSGYSYAKFSAKAGLGSPNYLKLVMDGKRALTVANIHQFAQALKLNDDELRYFEALVLFAQAKSPRERGYYAARMSAGAKERPRSTYQLTSESLLVSLNGPAVLVSAHGAKAGGEHRALARMVGISLSEYELALRKLLDKGLLKVEKDKYQMVFRNIELHDRNSTSASQKFYHRYQLEKTLRVLQRSYETSKAKFYVHTFTGSSERLRKCEQRLRDAVQSLLAEADNEPADCALQLNLQLFDLALAS